MAESNVNSTVNSTVSEPDEPRMRSKSTLKIGAEEMTVGDQIKKIGSGTYQIHIFVLCAGVLMSESAQLSAVAGIQNIVNDKFHVTTTLHRSLLMTFLYVGLTCGTIASGTIGDSRGRRLPILLGYIGMPIAQVLIWAFSTSLQAIYFLLLLLGLFAGIGIPAAVTLLSEVVPDHHRGLFGAALCLGFCMGELWTAIGLEIFVPDLANGCWHCPLLWAVVPPICLLFMGYCSRATRFDSPHFLAVRGQPTNLVLALNLMAEMNGHPEFVASSPAKTNPEHGREDPPMGFGEMMQRICSGRMGVWTAVLSYLFFSVNMCYYGTVEFWPIGWSALDMKGMDSGVQMICTALMGFMSVPIAMFSMANFPRRLSLSLVGLLCTIAVLCLRGLILNNLVQGWMGVSMFKLLWMTFQMTTINLPGEIYPTRVSVWGWSLVCFFGRLGCILAPIVMEISNVGYLYVAACLLSLASMLVWLLPETSKVELDELDMLDSSEQTRAEAVQSKGYGSLKEP